jgi:hypothetical protein
MVLKVGDVQFSAGVPNNSSGSIELSHQAIRVISESERAGTSQGSYLPRK